MSHGSRGSANCPRQTAIQGPVFTKLRGRALQCGVRGDWRLQHFWRQCPSGLLGARPQEIPAGRLRAGILVERTTVRWRRCTWKRCARLASEEIGVEDERGGSPGSCPVGRPLFHSRATVPWSAGTPATSFPSFDRRPSRATSPEERVPGSTLPRPRAVPSPSPDAGH